MTKAYARFKGQGFEILSYSMDENLKAAVAARKKHNMTWLTAIDPELKGFDGKIAETMYVGTVPTAYLVAADGTILAREWQIENDNLEKFLEKFFSENKKTSRAAVSSPPPHARE